MRANTRETYGPRWQWFLGFCKGKNVIPQTALLPFTVKFIRHMFKTGVSHAVMASAIAAASKYHISNKDSGVKVGRLPWLLLLKNFLTTKAFLAEETKGCVPFFTQNSLSGM